ncbi:hypothetical protein [Companilactobacillus jidongensis]|uniref:hypothetical protein n=1 Tax=Companilactobacillus jidongensis TaxID=2486006 RepID=UPI000F76A1EC|nr:hypothetical protein [Companilactobacillus jidongensis]
MTSIKILSNQDLQKTVGGGKSPYYEPWRTPGKMNPDLGWTVRCSAATAAAILKKDPTQLISCM